jgi:hypothetical protein
MDMLLTEQKTLYQELREKAAHYGQGMTELVETLQAAERFTGAIERQQYNEIFAEAILMVIAQFEKYLLMADKAKTAQNKIKILEGIKKLESYGFTDYLQTEFTGRLYRLIDVGAKAHSIEQLQIEEDKLMKQEQPTESTGNLTAFL